MTSWPIGWPNIGFEKNISAAEKTFKTLAFFSYFGNHLKRENRQECSKIIRVQYALVFVITVIRFEDICKVLKCLQ